MFMGSPERPLSALSDETMYTFIWHIFMEICQIEESCFGEWGYGFVFFMRNMTSEKLWEVIMSTHYYVLLVILHACQARLLYSLHLKMPTKVGGPSNECRAHSYSYSPPL